MTSSEKYPPPRVPEGCSAKLVAGGSYDYWVVVNEEGNGLLWLDCKDKPEYYALPVVAPSIQAESYEQAKKHIEALLALGEI